MSVNVMFGDLRKHIYGILFWTLLLSSCGTRGRPGLVDTLGSVSDQSGVVFEPDLRQSAPIIVVATVVQNSND